MTLEDNSKSAKDFFAKVDHRHRAKYFIQVQLVNPMARELEVPLLRWTKIFRTDDMDEMLTEAAEYLVDRFPIQCGYDPDLVNEEEAQEFFERNEIMMAEVREVSGNIVNIKNEAKDA